FQDQHLGSMILRRHGSAQRRVPCPNNDDIVVRIAHAASSRVPRMSGIESTSRPTSVWSQVAVYGCATIFRCRPRGRAATSRISNPAKTGVESSFEESASIDLDTGFLDHFAILRDVGLNHGSKFLRRARNGF